MRLRIVIAGVLLLAVSACTSVGSGQTGANSSPTRSAKAVGCVAATHLASARSGRISAGPFAANSGQWRRAKFWVGSSRPHPDHDISATIRATSLRAGVEPVTVYRGPKQRASVPDPDLPVFFPGLLRLPSHGTWQITVEIGPDRGCFQITA